MVRILQKLTRDIVCAVGESYESAETYFVASDFGRWCYYVPKFQKGVARAGFWFLLGVFVATYGEFK